MANRAVVVDLLVRTGQFTAGLKRASHDMASETTNMDTKARALQAQFGLLGVALVGAAATAVVQWARFDQAMTRTSAVSEDAAARIGELNEAAKSDEVIRLGYDALGASDSIYELTKAGVGASDIIGGALSGALSLAAVEAMDAGEAASIMASALTQFNLTGADAGHAADLIASGAAKAQGSAHDLGFALKQSGLVANQFGLSIEDTVGTLSFFAKAGLIGSDAGTSLRTMLLHLAGPSTKAAELMDDIGLEVYGANGQMVDMATLADNLQASLGTLSEEQRNQALATIFGADATRAASLLYREGGDALQEWTDTVDESGFAADAAAKMMDNLGGDVKKLSATWERSMINMGESADGPLRDIVQGVTGLIDWFGELPPAIQGVIMALTGGGGLVILATLGIAQVVSALSTLQTGLVATGVVTQATANKMATAFGKVTKALGIVGLAAGVAIAIFAATKDQQDLLKISTDDLAASYDVATGKFTESAKALASDQIFEKFGWWDRQTKSFDSIADAAEHLKVPLGDLTDAMLGNEAAAARVQAAIDAAYANPNLGKREKIGSSWTTPGDLQAVIDAEALLNRTIADNVKVTGEAKTQAEKMAEAQEGSVGQSEDLAGQVAELNGEMAGLEDGTAAVTAAEVEAQRAHEQYIASIVDSFTSFSTLGDVYQGVIDAQKEWAESAAEETASSKDSWEDFYDGQSVSADQYIAELERQVKAQEEWADNLLSLTARATDKMPADLQAAALEMIEELRGLGPEGAAQIALLESMSDEELQKVVELYRRQGAATGAAWAEEVEAAETPEVEVDTSQAEADLYSFKGMLDDVDDRTIVVPFKVDISPAERSLADIKAQIAASNGQGITVFGAGAPSSISRAGGGEVLGPGTGTSDSIPALLSNGEHVLTADDVQKAGGQAGVYRMRAAIQSGLLRFASGGAVGAKGRSWEYWDNARLDQGEILDLRIRIRDLKRDLAASGEDRLRGLERDKAQYELKQAQKELDEGLYANGLNKTKSLAKRIQEQEAAAEEKERKARVAEQRADYSTDMRRGTFTDDLTSGVSGVYGMVDRLRDSVLPNLAGKQKTELADALRAAVFQAEELYSRLDGVNDELESATEQADELRSIADGVQGSLEGGFSLSDSLSATKTAAVNPFTGVISGGGTTSSGQGMLRAAQAYSEKVKIFSGKLKSLADRGFAGVILQEIAAMGVDAGIPAADALLTLDPSDTSAMNEAYANISAFAGQAGQAVTEGFYEGGLAAADGIVAGLEAKRGDVQDAIMQMALDMQNALKTALGIASPSRKFRTMMKFVGDGVVLGLDDQVGAVADASARLFDGVRVPGGPGGYGAGGTASGLGGDITASLSDAQVERLAVAFETGNVRNINAATAQQNRKVVATYGVRGR